MAEGEQRIEVLEDEMKVLKGEVSRTLVDLRALLMREDSPLSSGSLRGRPAQTNAVPEPQAPISIPTPEEVESPGAGATEVAINAGGGEDQQEAANSPSTLDGLIGNLAALAQVANTPAGAPPGVPPGPPVKQNTPENEVVLRHEIGGDRDDAEIEARRVRLRELEREEEKALEERARRRQEDEKEEKAALERRENLRKQTDEDLTENRQRTRRQQTKDMEDEAELERRDRRRKQDEQEDEERKRSARRRDQDDQEESAELDARERRRIREQEEEKRDSRSATRDESDYRDAPARGTDRDRDDEDDESEGRGSSASGRSRTTQDQETASRSRRSGRDDEHEPDEPHRSRHPEEFTDRDSRAQIDEESEDWRDDDFSAGYRDGDDDSESLVRDAEYDYEMNDDKGFYEDSEPTEGFMERGRESERETGREDRRDGSRTGRDNRGRRPSDRGPRPAARNARDKRDRADRRGDPAEDRAGSYDNRGPSGYPVTDRRNEYPRYPGEPEFNGQDGRRRPRPPVDDQRGYGSSGFYGEFGRDTRGGPPDGRHAPESREFANGYHGAEYGNRPPQPEYGDYGWGGQPATGYGEAGYGQRQYPQQPGQGRTNHPTMDLNLVASLLRWAAIAKHRVGDKRLSEIVELYVESRSAPPGLKEALDHITSVADEQAPDSGQNTQEALDLISHLHGILTATLPVPMVPNIKGNLKIGGEVHNNPRGDW